MYNGRREIHYLGLLFRSGILHERQLAGLHNDTFFNEASSANDSSNLETDNLEIINADIRKISFEIGASKPLILSSISSWLQQLPPDHYAAGYTYEAAWGCLSTGELAENDRQAFK